MISARVFNGRESSKSIAGTASAGSSAWWRWKKWISHGSGIRRRSGLPGGLVDHRRHGLGGLAVVVGQQMPVAVQREDDRGVAAPAADRFHVPADPAQV